MILTLLLMLFASPAHAGDCKLPPGKEKITIGCTHGCGEDGSIRPAIEAAAKTLGMNVDIKDVDPKNIDKSIKNFDAFLSGGGHDFDPKWEKNLPPKKRKQQQEAFDKYGNLNSDLLPQYKPEKETDEQLARDKFEAAFMDRYMSRQSPAGDKPFLGICYGMQMLAARSGLPMIEDIPAELKYFDTRKTSNRITMTKGSALAPFVKADALNSFVAPENHHQAVDLDYYLKNKKQFPNVRVYATSHDGHILEGIEVGKNAMGVQFHAERSEDPGVRIAPFKWLLTKACLKINKHAEPSIAK